MMKTIKTIIAILAVSIFAMSCSKDDDPSLALAIAPLQDPLAGYLNASGLYQKVSIKINGPDYEFGYSFIPLVNGKMTAIVAKIPDIRMAMRVTIWDKVAGTVLLTEAIDIVAAGVVVTKQISPLDLVKNKEYFITINSNDWYERKRTDNNSAFYPITVGDLQITSYSYRSGTAQAIPNSPQNNFYSGDLSFTFQK